MKKRQPTEYAYASARIRALENRMVGRERMERLLESRDGDEVMERLAEYGLAPREGAETREAVLSSALRAAYDEVEASAPDPALFRFFRYPYDCNNLKAAVKCAVRGISASDLLFDFGTVPADEVEPLLREGKLHKFPPAMAAAVPVARELYDKTGDPRRIDTALDRACFEDMLAVARGDDTLSSWLRARVDLTNILMTVRILRMNLGETGVGFLAESLLPGGTLPAEALTASCREGEERLWALVQSTVYHGLLRVEGDPRPLSALERAADDLYMEQVRRDAKTPFGVPVVAGYLVGWEMAVKNIRIILAAKDAGLSPSVLRERIRLSYV